MLEAQVNHAPRIGTPFSAPDATEDAPFAFTLPSDAFFDPDANDALTFSATLAGGSPLPAWLSFDGTMFSGTPGNADVGSIEVEVTATDRKGLSVADAFMLDVANVNDAPVLLNPVAKTMDCGWRRHAVPVAREHLHGHRRRRHAELRSNAGQWHAATGVARLRYRDAHVQRHAGRSRYRHDHNQRDCNGHERRDGIGQIRSRSDRGAGSHAHRHRQCRSARRPFGQRYANRTRGQ